MTRTDTPTLRDIPAVRALAETRANDLHRILFGRPTDGDRLAQWREAHLDLLCDLTRPESAACIMQAVADRVGYPRHCGLCLVRNGAHGWALFNGLNPGVQFVGNLRGWPKHPAPVLVPALIGITDPTTVLALIATHVLSERA